MDFNSKDYQIIKLKKYYKNSDILFLFQSSRLGFNEWMHTEQTLKKLKLKYYKPLNRTTLKILESSVYKHFSPAISGFVLLVEIDFEISKLNLELISKKLKPSFSLISVKLNNKMYFTSQLKDLKNLSYRKNICNLYKNLDKHLKTAYVLTNKKKTSK